MEGKNQGTWPAQSHLRFEFPARANMPPVTIHFYQDMPGDVKCPEGMAEGERLLPASRWAEYNLPSQLLPLSVNHQMDWVRACKGGRPGCSEFSVAVPYIEWLILGAVALQVPGKLLWDAGKIAFSNNEKANALLRPCVRKGWELKL